VLPHVLNSQGRLSAAVLASGTLHLLLSLDIPEPAPGHRLDTKNQMDFEVVIAPPAPREDAKPEHDLAGASPEPSAQRERTPAPPPKFAPAPPPELAPAARSNEGQHAAASELVREGQDALQRAAAKPDVTAAAEPGVAAEPGLAVGSRTLDLSARAAARTLTADGVGSFSVPRQAREVEDPALSRAAEERLARGIEGLSRAGDDKVDYVAEEVTWAIAKPWDVILSPMRGARYTFHGVGFDAIIQRDGSIKYRDKGGPHVAGSQTRHTAADQAEAEHPPAQTLGLGFDGALLSRLVGSDSHRSERRSFLERTRPLRELLHERARQRALARAAIHLGKNLALIENRLSAGDAAFAHARLFALWDECAEDEVGNVARWRIEAFAREHCREDSSSKFEAEELTALNRKRLSRGRFDPYRMVADAGLLLDASSEVMP
jgi:hypothetical protein